MSSSDFSNYTSNLNNSNNKNDLPVDFLQQLNSTLKVNNEKNAGPSLSDQIKQHLLLSPEALENDQFLATLQYQRQQVKASPFSDMLHKEDRAATIHKESSRFQYENSQQTASYFDNYTRNENIGENNHLNKNFQPSDRYFSNDNDSYLSSESFFLQPSRFNKDDRENSPLVSPIVRQNSPLSLSDESSDDKSEEEKEKKQVLPSILSSYQLTCSTSSTSFASLSYPSEVTDVNYPLVNNTTPTISQPSTSDSTILKTEYSLSLGNERTSNVNSLSTTSSSVPNTTNSNNENNEGFFVPNNNSNINSFDQSNLLGVDNNADVIHLPNASNTSAGDVRSGSAQSNNTGNNNNTSISLSSQSNSASGDGLLTTTTTTTSSSSSSSANHVLSSSEGSDENKQDVTNNNQNSSSESSKSKDLSLSSEEQNIKTPLANKQILKNLDKRNATTTKRRTIKKNKPNFQSNNKNNNSSDNKKTSTNSILNTDDLITPVLPLRVRQQLSQLRRLRKENDKLRKENKEILEELDTKTPKLPNYYNNKKGMELGNNKTSEHYSLSEMKDASTYTDIPPFIIESPIHNRTVEMLSLLNQKKGDPQTPQKQIVLMSDSSTQTPVLFSAGLDENTNQASISNSVDKSINTLEGTKEISTESSVGSSFDNIHPLQTPSHLPSFSLPPSSFNLEESTRRNSNINDSRMIKEADNNNISQSIPYYPLSTPDPLSNNKNNVFKTKDSNSSFALLHDPQMYDKVKNRIPTPFYDRNGGSSSGNNFFTLPPPPSHNHHSQTNWNTSSISSQNALLNNHISQPYNIPMNMPISSNMIPDVSISTPSPPFVMRRGMSPQDLTDLKTPLLPPYVRKQLSHFHKSHLLSSETEDDSSDESSDESDSDTDDSEQSSESDSNSSNDSSNSSLKKNKTLNKRQRRDSDTHNKHKSPKTKKSSEKRKKHSKKHHKHHHRHTSSHRNHHHRSSNSPHQASKSHSSSDDSDSTVKKEEIVENNNNKEESPVG